MTPNELYAMEPESRNLETHVLFGCYYCHVPELREQDALIQHERNERIEIRYLKEFYFDHRRFWRLATVWFNRSSDPKAPSFAPFMVIQNAGREGDDHSQAFVTDLLLYSDAVQYLRSLIPSNDPFLDTPNWMRVDANQEVDNLTEFYSQSLNGPFERY